MRVDLQALFEACEQTLIGQGIRQSVWLFPAIEAVHLLALALLGGAVLMLDLRLLGLGLIQQPTSVIERQTRPWLIGAVGTLIATGTLLFLSEALKLYGKEAFWIKMAALVTVLAYTFAVRNPLARRDLAVGALSRSVATVSIALWLVVASAGRWIGFS
jgi:protein-S-isoprenylcysteine O-methyltransferase Ste14